MIQDSIAKISILSIKKKYLLFYINLFRIQKNKKSVIHKVLFELCEFLVNKNKPQNKESNTNTYKRKDKQPKPKHIHFTFFALFYHELGPKLRIALNSEFF